MKAKIREDDRPEIWDDQDQLVRAGTDTLPAVLEQDGVWYVVFGPHVIPHLPSGKLLILAEAPEPAQIDRMESHAFAFMTLFNAWMQRHEEQNHDGRRCDEERANLLAFVAHRIGVNDRVWELYEETIKLYHERHVHGQ